MKLHTFRIKPGNDLKTELEEFVKAHDIQAGFIITCVGGLSQATMRMAGALPSKQDIRSSLSINLLKLSLSNRKKSSRLNGLSEMSYNENCASIRKSILRASTGR